MYNKVYFKDKNIKDKKHHAEEVNIARFYSP